MGENHREDSESLMMILMGALSSPSFALHAFSVFHSEAIIAKHRTWKKQQKSVACKSLSIHQNDLSFSLSHAQSHIKVSHLIIFSLQVIIIMILVGDEREKERNHFSENGDQTRNGKGLQFACSFWPSSQNTKKTPSLSGSLFFMPMMIWRQEKGEKQSPETHVVKRIAWDDHERNGNERSKRIFPATKKRNHHWIRNSMWEQS